MGLGMFGRMPSAIRNTPITSAPMDRPAFTPEDEALYQTWFGAHTAKGGVNPMVDYRDAYMGGETPPAPPPLSPPEPAMAAPMAAPEAAPAAPKSQRGAFANGHKRPSTLGLIGATLGDISAGLDRRQGGNVTGLMDRTKAEGQDEEFQTLIDGMEMDPLEAMLAKTNRDGYLTAKVGDRWKDEDYAQRVKDETAAAERKRGYEVEDRDLGIKSARELKELDLNKPRIENTGQAVVRVDPATGDTKVLYRDQQNPGAGRKQFRAATPEEMKARGYPAGSTGQFDSDGRLYPDKAAKAQSQYSPAEIRSYRDKSDGLMTLGNAVSKYVEALKGNGGPQMFDTPLNRNNTQAIKAAHGLITSAIKDADSLGALDQGVQNLVNSIISNPVGLDTIGKSTESIEAAAKELYDSIDYRLSRVPEDYRGGATGNTEMSWRSKYTPEQVTQAKAALANWDRLPANFRTPALRARAEEIAGAKAPVAKPSVDDDVSDDDYDNAMSGFSDMDIANAPEGVEPGLWDQLTDEEKREFLGGE